MLAYCSRNDSKYTAQVKVGARSRAMLLPLALANPESRIPNPGQKASPASGLLRKCAGLLAIDGRMCDGRGGRDPAC